MIDLTHMIPVYGHWKAYHDTMDALEEGQISSYSGGAYLGSLYGATTIHQIHMAQKTGRVSPFAVSAVRTLQRTPHIAMAAVPIMLAGANMEQIEKAPDEQQRGLWQMFASGLTGTFGIGSGLNL